MLTRLFLTLLALLTGLAASNAPAHARIARSGEAEIGAVAAPAANARIAIARSSSLPNAGQRRLRFESPGRRPEIVPVPRRTAEIGIDRARE